jgi:biopolymer transport protein ExbD
VKRNEKYNEVRLPKGTVIDGENLEGFKFYPLEIIDTGAKTFKISVKEKENIYLDNGYKFTGKELYDAINNSKKDVNNNFKFRRNQNALQYKMVKKVLGEEI